MDSRLKTAKERYRRARDAMRETRERMIEDLKFSNPTDPKQWDDAARQARENSPDGARPCLTFDQTNQYIAQVVNDGRQNKPSIKAIPVGSNADVKVATACDGMIRHIEYQSRAQIAYDTALEYSARIGLGWIRVMPEVVDPKLNYQEPRIKRVHDPLAVTIDDQFTEPDGRDAKFAFIECTYSPASFKAEWPKARVDSWEESDGWVSAEGDIKVAEYFYVEEKETNRIRVKAEDDAEGEEDLSEEDYWARNKVSKLDSLGNYSKTERRVVWLKMTGSEILEETEFPSEWIGLVPVIGDELWIEGKRYISGLVRRMRDPQRAYNYGRSSEVEVTALQPKAPYLADWRGIENHQDAWGALNVRNQAYLPYDSFDADGKPIAAPSRVNPPAPTSAFNLQSQQAQGDLQASIGMYRANLGAPSNETSGIAIQRRQREGDTANFHYIDNQARSIEQVGRIVMDMLGRLVDTQREMRMLGDDGKPSTVTVNPDLETPFAGRDGKVEQIRLDDGYDVRITVGASYTTQRQETSDALTQIISKRPDLIAILGPTWAKVQDFPEAEKLARVFTAMAPPQVQAIENGEQEVPPKALAQIQQLQQQLQQMGAAMEKLTPMADANHVKVLEAAAKAENEAYKAETDRLKALNPPQNPGMSVEQVQSLVMELLLKHQATPQGNGPAGMAPAAAPAPDLSPAPGMDQMQPAPGAMAPNAQMGDPNATNPLAGATA
jgi:hypothetical protein